MRFSVLGAGGWGTAVARLLANNSHNTILWARNPDRAAQIARNRENKRYLPGVLLPTLNLRITADLEEALDVDAIFLAVPSFAMADLLERLAGLRRTPKTVINLAKGLDRASRRTISALIEEHLPEAAAFTLSGPSHAEEVGRDMPTAVVLAGSDPELGAALQREIATSRFRIYLSNDIRGVELCATVKNIIAIATGISDGLGYGDNSRGALITRGLTEMARFGRVFSIKRETLFGLSGLGDLVATCTSKHSRNRYVGYRLGKGERIEDILSGMEMVAEGVYATRIVYAMAKKRGIEMPITEAVHDLLSGKADPLSLVERIMTRSPKREDLS